MPLDDVLRLILVAADDCDRLFDRHEIARWPVGAVEHFIRLGVLRASQGGLMAPCPHCPEGHVEPVVIGPNVGGRVRWFIACPESLRVEVTPEMCSTWEIDPDGLAIAVGTSLAVRGSPRAIVPNRLWRIGRVPWHGKTRDVLLARRLGDPDAASVIAHAPSGGQSIVIVPHQLPDERLWRGRVPAVAALSEIASVDATGLAIDPIALADLVGAADELAESRSHLPTDPEVKKRVVRSQIKAEIKGHLEDDVLVAAVKKEGSVRKAAAFLTKELGRPVSKDKVQRAVTRAGGVKKILRSDDSPSVARTVASQPRDRRKNFAQRR